jgi:hypothetical protein
MIDSPNNNTADATAEDISSLTPASAERLNFLSKAAKSVSGKVANSSPR